MPLRNATEPVTVEPSEVVLGPEEVYFLMKFNPADEPGDYKVEMLMNNIGPGHEMSFETIRQTVLEAVVTLMPRD